ncbi:MAG: tRNA (adenosine(37)-N6)-dimethylallyltransferase MiaA [Patescibacteria group bacterium]|nr:tRNA (adenosine(37)-N6)-dimethylallyltransferase MiaA [Patescibacteria group bacterium]
MQKLLVILGPTASGKSTLAVELAKKLNGLHAQACEVISADSRQVYKGLDIGTGKITQKEMDGVVHHMLDVENPKNRFDITKYQKLAKQKIEEILSRGHLPIICGGTGFYISSIVNNLSFPPVPPNKKLREKLSKYSTETLFEKLEKLDPVRASSIDSKNKIRLIRALEIIQSIGKVPQNSNTECLSFDTLQIGIETSPEKLKENINKRLISRIKVGMIEEAEKLHNPPTGKGLSWKRMEELGLEYRYLAYYLQKKITKEEMITKLQTEIWHYAKRQMTWFKKDKRIKWFKIEEKDDIILLCKRAIS